MKQLALIGILILMLTQIATGVEAGGRFPTAARDGCAVDFYVYGGLQTPRAGLRVWINGDADFVTTDAAGHAWIPLPIGANVAVLRVTDGVTPGGLWTGGVACATAGVFRLEAYVK